MQDPIVIVGAARTPMGAFMGDFASLAAHDLGAAAIKAAVARRARRRRARRRTRRACRAAPGP